MKLKREDTAILLVDIQERLSPAIHEGEDVVQKAATLVRGARIMGVPVLVLRQYPKGLGDTVPALREALGDYTPHDKVCFSGCGCESLMAALRATGCKNVLVAGMEAHVCVLQSVIDLVAEGFTPALVCDCVGSRAPYDKKIALKRAMQEGALLTTCEAALFELLGGAGDEHFKEISRLLK